MCESSVTASAAANTTRCREESIENATGSLAGCCVRTLRETRGEALAGFGAAGRSALLEAASFGGQRAGGDGGASLGGSICAGRMLATLVTERVISRGFRVRARRPESSERRSEALDPNGAAPRASRGSGRCPTARVLRHFGRRLAAGALSGLSRAALSARFRAVAARAFHGRALATRAAAISPFHGQASRQARAAVDVRHRPLAARAHRRGVPDRAVRAARHPRPSAERVAVRGPPCSTGCAARATTTRPPAAEAALRGRGASIVRRRAARPEAVQSPRVAALGQRRRAGCARDDSATGRARRSRQAWHARFYRVCRIGALGLIRKGHRFVYRWGRRGRTTTSSSTQSPAGSPLYVIT